MNFFNTQIVILEYLLPQKEISFLEKWLTPSLGQEVYKRILENIVISGSKEVFKGD